MNKFFKFDGIKIKIENLAEDSTFDNEILELVKQEIRFGHYCGVVTAIDSNKHEWRIVELLDDSSNTENIKVEQGEFDIENILYSKDESSNLKEKSKFMLPEISSFFLVNL